MPYQPDEYFVKVGKIKEEMRQCGIYGKWFSSPYPFEDTKAAEEFAWVRHPDQREQKNIKEISLETTLWEGMKSV